MQIMLNKHSHPTQNPSLHLAIPALEALHKAWKSRLTKPKYALFQVPLQTAVDKIAQYYEKTSDSDAYIMAMREYLVLVFLYCVAEFSSNHTGSS